MEFIFVLFSRSSLGRGFRVGFRRIRGEENGGWISGFDSKIYRGSFFW